MTHCLIVDGSSVVRKVAKRILTTPLDDVVEADNGNSALGALASGGADIVMVDGDLPDMDITDFIRNVRAMHGVRQPKIVVMMTEMNLALMTKAKRAGANDYLLKPFDRSQLTRRLHDFQRAA
ncbi:MAG: response regulator [Oricola sp.]